MVTDSLQNLEQYRGLHKNMDTVIDFLKKCDLTALPDGKTVIDGERVFVNVMEADLREIRQSEQSEQQILILVYLLLCIR